jgi:outer membrane protein assembly factor BamB
MDCFRCLDARTGKERWALPYVAQGRLDYGNSPRATPLIAGQYVFLYGAFGDLHCVELNTGDIVWQKNLRLEFGADDKLIWGTTSAPLIVDGKLIVNPGGSEASLVALQPDTGDVVWKTSGRPAAFASFILATIAGKVQLVGYDKTTLGGWDPATGTRLWELTPPGPEDFNVPTPIFVENHLIASTENHGTRMYAFDEAGRINPQPVAVYEDLAPDTHTPVAVGGRLFGVWQGLHCLDLRDGLKLKWLSEENGFFDYCTLVASEDRLLTLTLDGTLLLFDTTAAEPKIVGRCKLFEKDGGCFSHPALVGDRLFVRGSREIIAVDLSRENTETQK